MNFNQSPLSLGLAQVDVDDPENLDAENESDSEAQLLQKP